MKTKEKISNNEVKCEKKSRVVLLFHHWEAEKNSEKCSWLFDHSHEEKCMFRFWSVIGFKVIQDIQFKKS